MASGYVRNRNFFSSFGRDINCNIYRYNNGILKNTATKGYK
jgi:hypothetical protein